MLFNINTNYVEQLFIFSNLSLVICYDVAYAVWLLDKNIQVNTISIGLEMYSSKKENQTKQDTCSTLDFVHMCNLDYSKP